MNGHGIGICLIGTGRAGMIHAKNFRRNVPGAYLAAVVDVNEERAKAAAQELGIEAYFTDHKRALTDRAVQAVVIVVPTNLHRQIVVDCADAGKHILCEKPMALKIEECDEMTAACGRNNVKMQIGFMRRFDESFRKAKALVDAGQIGDLVLIKSCTRGPSKPQSWMYDVGRSNGILAEVNSHDIDSVRWFSGSDVSRLYAIGGNYRNPEQAEAYPGYYDSVVMNGVMENGVQFCIDGAAYVQYGYDSRVELIGTKGVIHVGRSEKEFIRCTTAENGTSAPFIDSWRTLFKDAYLAEDIAFADCIRKDANPGVTGIDGRAVVQIVEAGNQSIAKGKVVALHSEKL